MKKKLPIYEINIDYACIVNDLKLVSLLSFINNNDIDFLLERKESVFYDENNRLRVVPRISDINHEIESILDYLSIPSSLLFVYKDDDENNTEYIYITEIFTGVTVRVDKTLVSYFQISRAQANIKMLQYDLDQVQSINELMLDVQEGLNKRKIIDFPIKRIKER